MSEYNLTCSQLCKRTGLSRERIRQLRIAGRIEYELRGCRYFYADEIKPRHGEIPDGYIRLSEFAKLHDVTYDAILLRVLDKSIETLSIGGIFYVHRDHPYRKWGRGTRKQPLDIGGGKT